MNIKEKAIVGKKCFECDKIFKEGDEWFYYYHGDQDDRVCEDCVKVLKQIDTAYSGMLVIETG